MSGRVEGVSLLILQSRTVSLRRFVIIWRVDDRNNQSFELLDGTAQFVLFDRSCLSYSNI